MTVDQQSTSRPPDVARSGVEAVFVSSWYVPDGVDARKGLDDVAQQWADQPWPPGLVSVSTYVSVTGTGTTALTYVQTTRAGDKYPLTRAPAFPAVKYRLRRSLRFAPAEAQSAAFIVAMFDVDGPERQDHVVSSVTATLEEQDAATRHPGLISANFHVSTDGTRVLNYAEWTDDAAHEDFLAGQTRSSILRGAQVTPGVRPIGFTRFHLHATITAS